MSMMTWELWLAREVIVDCPLDTSKIENKVKLSKPFMYEVSQMNPTLEYIYNHPKETKRIIGITYEQLIKLIAKAQIIESEKKEAIAKTEKD